MGQHLRIHPQSPQPRLIRQAVDVIESGGVVVFPTDSCYAIGCQLADKVAVERITRIRGFEGPHHFTLLCRDLSQLGTYARVDNTVFRLLRHYTPGPYTFILTATR